MSEYTSDHSMQHECEKANAEIDRLKEENQKLKEAAEMEFQRAEGKAEMKRWFQEELVKRNLIIDELAGALKDSLSLLLFFKNGESFEMIKAEVKDCEEVLKKYTAFRSGEEK